MSILRLKSGFTLMELMVYIALLGGIVLIAGKAFSDSSRLQSGTQSMLQATQMSENVAVLIKKDFAQAGAKSFKTANTDNFGFLNAVYMDPNNVVDSLKDFSSYIHARDSVCEKKRVGDSIKIDTTRCHRMDTFTMRRIRYQQNGDYEAIEHVTWFADTTTNELKRYCRSLNRAVAIPEDPTCLDSGHAKIEDAIIVASGLYEFKLIPGTPTVTESAASVLPSDDDSVKSFKLVSRFGDSIYEPLNAEPVIGGEVVTLSGFYMNYDFIENKPITNADAIKANQVFVAPVGANTNSWNTQCKKFNLEPNIVYEISFSMPLPNTDDDPSRMFCPGRDHMTVGFRYASNGAKPGRDTLPDSDFQFYPPTSISSALPNDDTGFRKMRFIPRDTIKNVCLGFTFAFFSPVASSGNIKIANLKLKKIPSSNYRFMDEPISIVDKKNVKAVKMKLSVLSNSAVGTDSTTMFMPSNGLDD